MCIRDSAGTHHVDDAHCAHAAVPAQAQSGQGVGGLAALADDQRERIRLQHGVAVTEFAGDVDLHRQAGQALEYICLLYTSRCV